MKIPEGEDCIHAGVCKHDNQMCAADCGYFEEHSILKPISTAPRDGSHILLYRPDIFFVGYYNISYLSTTFNSSNYTYSLIIPPHFLIQNRTPYF